MLLVPAEATAPDTTEEETTRPWRAADVTKHFLTKLHLSWLHCHTAIQGLLSLREW